ncbi:thioredoxin-disulfide reductase [Blastocladiella emersonii ATCC 22665]|nr:thioredoxin-disulfide reductase [Blastocladiella emersonii ATCC 22665]
MYRTAAAPTMHALARRALTTPPSPLASVSASRLRHFASWSSSSRASTAHSTSSTTRRIAARTLATSAVLSFAHSSTDSAPAAPTSGLPKDSMTKINKVIIVGSGPAAHTAAIYTGRANLEPIMYEGFMAGGIAAGGQLTTTTEVENFPGWPTGITGSELMDRMRSQSEHCGTKIITETIERVDLSSRPFKLWPEGASEPVLTESLIIATGATARRLHLPGEDKFWNAGMSACAVCDGPAPIFRNKPLAVLGGGDSACEEATYLTKYASKVYLIVRRDKLRASKVMAHRAMTHPKIEILWNTLPVEAKGDGRLLESMTLESTHPDTKGERRELAVNGFFYAIGHQPNVSLLAVPDHEGKFQIATDAEGYVVHPEAGSTMTSVPGVFACGDVADKKYRQAITAAGSGCAAALDCERWLEAIEAEEH